MILGLTIPSIAAPPSPVTLSNIELVTVSEDHALATWVTNLQADTTIQWGQTQELGNEYHLDESTNYHMGKMEDLIQGTTYYFRVGSNEVWSSINSFTTLTDPGGDLRIAFAVVADPHFDADGTNTANGNMYEDGPRLLSSLVDELNDRIFVDFVITLGDLTNGAEADYSGFTTTMNNLDVSWYPLMGNWDKNEEGWAAYYDTYMGRTETYYSMDYGGYHLVILDSAVSGQVGGDLDDEQLVWLEDDLGANSQMPTLLFLHHLADRTDDIFGIDQQAQDSLFSILSKNPQVMSIHSGHIHQNILSTFQGISNLDYASVVQYPMGYSIINLYDGGVTQSFHKLESELETSEESRLRINTNSGDSDADEDYLGDLSERSLVFHIPGNKPPTISTVEVDSYTVKPKKTVTITVMAEDEDGDQLTYHYESTEGTIIGAGSEVQWKAPSKNGDIIIQVWVSDGEKNSDKESVSISVAGDSSGDGDDATPGFDAASWFISIIIISFIFKMQKKRRS
jgi:hypothetical protein